MKIFSREELKNHDGTNGTSYVAYRGKVYDISGSFQWKKGAHQVSHRAGQDLTDALKDAPHIPDLLFKFPVVGKLAEGEKRK
ncbi:MAG: cytochrome B5 [Chloroflexi bacterium]|nr:cytochrome B5 [Chloroflexota bacterium]